MRKKLLVGLEISSDKFGDEMLPNVSPIDTERTRYDMKNSKNIYFCKDCTHNTESIREINKCKFCGSNNIYLIKKNKNKLGKYSIAKQNLNNQFVGLITKEHKNAKVFEKVFYFIRKKIQ